MKAIKLIVISLVCMFAFASCDQDKIITADQLPAAAQSYVQKTYPGVGITYESRIKNYSAQNIMCASITVWR